MMTKKVKLLVAILFVVLAGLLLAVAALGQATPPPKVCGDGKIDRPNDDGVFERCDAEGETEDCTPQCGEKLFGWAWADTFGWLSLNSDNCKYLGCDVTSGLCQDNGNYYVQISADTDESSDNLEGWAWSDKVGWVCFGSSCDPVNICRFASGSCNGADYGTLSPTYGWRALVESKDENPAVFKGWAKITALKDDGWLSLNCQNDELATGGYCGTSQHGLTVIEKDIGCKDSGSSKKAKVLSGFAWNNQGNEAGLGWVSFDPTIAELQPWLQTKYSDIYSRTGVRSLTGEAPGYNATYLILAKGAIVDFVSARGESWLDPNYGVIDFPTPQTRYSNVLGKLDITGLLCKFSSGRCTNSYGQKVIAIDDIDDLPTKIGPATSKYLDGNIYYADGNLTIAEAGTIQFTNETEFGNGAGTIIVDGDLTINSNIVYDDTDSLDKFRNLASVAWVVRGDLKIGPAVTNLAGNFIVLGDPEAGDCLADVGDDRSGRQENAGCGQVYSCQPYSASSCAQSQLRVSGLIMAKKFYLDRTFVDKYAAIKEGSEVVIYDGRLLANVPPGFSDFVKALPIWRSGVFSR